MVPQPFEFTNSKIETTGNLTIGQRITFTLGNYIENLVSDWMKLSGNLNVTGNVTIQGDSLTVNNIDVCLSDGTNCQSSITDTWWNITNSNYLYNNSAQLSINESKLNQTIITITDARDDTATGYGNSSEEIRNSVNVTGIKTG